MKRRIGALVLVLCMLLQLTVIADEAQLENGIPAEVSTLDSATDLPEYYTYIQKAEARYPAQHLPTQPAAGAGAEFPATVQGKEAVVLLSKDNALASFTVQVPEEGLYRLNLTYCLLMENTLNATFRLYVDGKMPYRNAQSLAFPRRFVNATGITTDANGNDRTPEQQEKKDWTTWMVDDDDIETNGGLCVWLSVGNHTITLETLLGGVAIASLTVENTAPLPTYEEYTSANADKEDSVLSDFIWYKEAEDYSAVSSSVITPTYDRSSVDTRPNDPAKLKLNTLGQDNWTRSGQWVEWQLDVPADGWYEIGMRVRQNTLRGAFSTRSIWLDGQQLFDGMQQITFDYNLQWYINELGDGQQAYRFYLTEGSHILRMKATQGAVAPCVVELQTLTLELNNLYREIIMVTGLSVDAYRDYMLDQQVPQLIERLTSIRDRLRTQMTELATVGIGMGSEAVVVDKLIYQIESFIAQPSTISVRLDDFLSNIGSMSSWVMSFTSQPLEIDYIYVKSPSVPLPKSSSGLWNQLVFRMKALLASFTEDYSMLTGDTEGGTVTENLRVWVALGRDQGQMIKDLTESRFTPETRVKVQISLMQTGLNEAIAAGRGPDIALFTGDVVNLASREAVQDLSDCDGFEETVSRFCDNSLNAFRYQDGVYALPLEQTVQMLFYRKDIFEELNISVPTTWDEFTEVLTVLQKNRLTAGLYAGTSTAGDPSVFELMLYQRGGSLFNEDLSATVLDDQLCYEAFRQWTQYYVRYSLPTEFDFYNRFRSGEMPLGIQPQSMYATLRLAAPELDGLWEMRPVPQMVDEDGNRSDLTVSTITPAIVLKGANKQVSFDYLKWFTSTDIQVAYGQGIENVLGLGARYNSANLEAVSQMNWTKEESTLLISQLKNGYVRPAVPASYYINRNLTNAFRKVIINGYTPREALMSYNKIINSEIARKDAELAARAAKAKKGD